MDILISSNLERLLYLLTGEDDAQIREWFTSLANDGKYEVSNEVKELLAKDFSAGFCDDADTKKTIKEIYDKYSYTCDTHTAVAVKVYNEYRANTGDTTKTIIASTASPYKFSASVLEAVQGKKSDLDEYEMIDVLNELSKIDIPKSLAELKDKERRFSDSIEKTDMKEYVIRDLKLNK
jgi:threonine synthase